ncbi:hypothetical protein [Sphingobacterium deserti]|nr:hypothetical protein [Sphingobacterium deserti]
MKKYLLCCLTTSALLLSCSKEAELTEPESEEKPVESSLLDNVSVKASKTKVNIFENVFFTMYVGKDENSASPLLLLGETELFDSAIWSVPEILYAKSTPSSVRGSMAQAFATPGVYKFSLSFFKKEKIIQSRELSVEVVDQRDFLNIVWDEGDKNDEGNFNPAAKDYFLSTKYNNGAIPYVVLNISFSPQGTSDLNFEKRIEEGGVELAAFFTSLYGDATLNAINIPELEGLSALYDRLFHNKMKDAKPKAIWQTNTTNIVIIEREDTSGLKYYSAIAEQK